MKSPFPKTISVAHLPTVHLHHLSPSFPPSLPGIVVLAHFAFFGVFIFYSLLPLLAHRFWIFGSKCCEVHVKCFADASVFSDLLQHFRMFCFLALTFDAHKWRRKLHQNCFDEGWDHSTILHNHPSLKTFPVVPTMEHQETEGSQQNPLKPKVFQIPKPPQNHPLRIRPFQRDKGRSEER